MLGRNMEVDKISNEKKVNGSDDRTKDNNKDREQWSGRADFILTCAGYSIGVGNIWRFPYLCYKNGGGAFPIPYITFLIVGALPMFLLEYSVSQFSSRSSLNIWIICPLMKGAGYGMVLVNLYITLYFNAIMAWVIYYFYHSFSSVLPWSTCDSYWNTVNCYSLEQKHLDDGNSSTPINASSLLSVLNGTGINLNASHPVSTAYDDMSLAASEEFWRFNVLNITKGLEDMGEVRVELLVCLVIAWFTTFICLLGN